MAGLASPDVPAVYCYLIVTVVGLFVARAHVKERLKDYPDHWAFLSAWLLFLAYWTIPVLLFWFLDYTGAVQDTSLFAALLVAFGFRQLFVGGVQGVNIPGSASALWKPFQAWVDKVAERINDRQGRYIDRFAEHLRSRVLRDPAKLSRLEILALQRSKKLPELRQAIAEAKNIPEESVAPSRLFDRLWPDLKASAPNEYGYLLHREGLISSQRRWWSLERGRAKTVTGVSLIGAVLLSVGVWNWAQHDSRSSTLWETAQRGYYHWRFLKANATERDRWRAREYLARELRLAAAQQLPLPAEARAQAQQALDQAAKAQRVLAEATSEEEKGRATVAVAALAENTKAMLQAERRAMHTDALVRPLVKELRYPEISSRQLDETLRFLMNHHAPHLDRYYLPELIESLRTPNEVVRLNIHKTLLALQQADFPKHPADARLASWEPRKNDSAPQIDAFVRLWYEWWRAAEAKLRS